MRKILDNVIVPFITGFAYTWLAVLLLLVVIIVLVFTCTFNTDLVKETINIFQKEFAAIYINIFGTAFGIARIIDKI